MLDLLNSFTGLVSRFCSSGLWSMLFIPIICLGIIIIAIKVVFLCTSSLVR